MDRKGRRRQQKNAVKETFRMVNTILLVVIAIAIVVFVAIFIKSQISSQESGSGSIFSGLFDEKTSAAEESSEESTSETAIEIADTSDGFHDTEDGRIIYLSHEEREKGTWLEADGGIYAIDSDGFVKTGSFDEDAFHFETTDRGAVKSIVFNKNYRVPSNGSGDYPYAVKSNALMAFLNTEKFLGRMVQIMYKKAAETMSHQLGGKDAPQYTVPGSLQVAGGYVFWLPSMDFPDEIEVLTANKLFRMRPGDEKRQVAAENVSGYKVIEDASGNVRVYYFADGMMHSTGDEGFVEDETAIVFTEDMEYRLDTTEEGKLYLVTESGYHVTKESDAFTVGDFVYQLSANGEILSVQPQETVKTDEYSYEIASDTAFGVSRSAVVRRKGDATEAISGEFFGTTGNLHLSKDSECMYAEYRDAMGNSRIIRITFDGDVDIVNGFDPGEKEILLCGNDIEGLVVKVIKEEGDRYEVVDTAHMTPLALGIEPMEIGETDLSEELQYPTATVVPGEGPDSQKVDLGIQYYAPGQPILPGQSIGKAP